MKITISESRTAVHDFAGKNELKYLIMEGGLFLRSLESKASNNFHVYILMCSVHIFGIFQPSAHGFVY